MENIGIEDTVDHTTGVVTMSGMVVIRVGPDRKEYRLPKGLLIHHSERFRQLLTGYPNDPDVSHITLAHTSVEVFNILVIWLCEHRLRTSAQISSCWSLLEAYILADFLSVNDLKTALIHMIFSILYFTHSYLDTNGVCRLFGALPEDDPLLQLAVDAFCINGGIRGMDAVEVARIEDLPKEYLVQIMRKLHRLSQQPEEQRILRRADYI